MKRLIIYILFCFFSVVSTAQIKTNYYTAEQIKIHLTDTTFKQIAIVGYMFSDTAYNSLHPVFKRYQQVLYEDGVSYNVSYHQYLTWDVKTKDDSLLISMSNLILFLHVEYLVQVNRLRILKD